jgi:CP12 domain
MVLLTLACSKPVIPPRRLAPKDIKRAIQQARNVCYNAETTPACRVMWDRVDELSHALARQQERELIKKSVDEDMREQELEKREYDV